MGSTPTTSVIMTSGIVATAHDGPQVPSTSLAKAEGKKAGKKKEVAS